MSDFGITVSDFTGRRTLGAVKVEMGDLSLWYSFGELVAFKVGKHDVVVKQVHMSPRNASTRRHLNLIDGGEDEAFAKRLPASQFYFRLSRVRLEIQVTGMMTQVDVEVKDGK